MKWAKRKLAGYLAAFTGRPEDSVPLSIIDHGDPEGHLSFAPVMLKSSTTIMTPVSVHTSKWPLPPGAYHVNYRGERVDPAENERVLTEIAPADFWLDLEDEALA